MISLKMTDFMERVSTIAPELQQNASLSDADRRVPDASIAAMEAAGLFRLWVPHAYGGYQTDLRTLMETAAAVGEYDGSAAWILCIMNSCAWLSSMFPQQAQDEVFGSNPHARIAGVPTPGGEGTREIGGYRITGKWYYASGSWHADWAVLGFLIKDEATQGIQHLVALIPASELRKDDTWHVTGMRGTGSISLEADHIFVPDHRIISLLPLLEGQYPETVADGEPLFCPAFLPVLFVVVVAPLLGLGKAALEIVTKKADTRRITDTFYDKQSASVGFQLQLAEAALLIDTAHLHFYRAVDAIDMSARTGRHPDQITRARHRADAAKAAESIVRAVDLLMYAHGAASFAESNTLQRIWRDVNTAARHGILLPAVSYEVYGKALLGVEERVTAFG